MPSYEIKAWLTIEAASKERAVDLAERTIEGFDAICRVARCQATEQVTFSTESTGPDLGIEEA